MTNKQTDLLALGAAAGILIASFLAFASTKSGAAYISISNMSALFYLLPLLGVIALVFAILSLSKKLEAKSASLALGATILGLSAFTGFQARAQLDGYVYMRYEMQAKQVQSAAKWAAIKRIADEAVMGNSADPTPQPPVPEVKPIVIADDDTSIWGPGFHLSIVASLVLLASGALSLKARPGETAAPL